MLPLRAAALSRGAQALLLDWIGSAGAEGEVVVVVAARAVFLSRGPREEFGIEGKSRL
jgi:hypothetical protein